jgi:hypothetical protein
MGLRPHIRSTRWAGLCRSPKAKQCGDVTNTSSAAIFQGPNKYSCIQHHDDRRLASSSELPGASTANTGAALPASRRHAVCTLKSEAVLMLCARATLACAGLNPRVGGLRVRQSAPGPAR